MSADVLIRIKTEDNGKFTAVMDVPDGSHYESIACDTLREAKGRALEMLEVVERTLPVKAVHWPN